MKTSILISKIRRGMSLPNVENRFSDLTILDLANDELQSSILPWLFALREDFLVANETYALNTLSEGKLRFPAYSSGRSLKDLWVSENDVSWKPLTRVGLESAWVFDQTNLGVPSSFWLQGDEIFVFPKPSATEVGSLKLFYHSLPNSLVLEERSVKIASILNENTVTVSLTPSFFAVNETLDLINQQPDYQVLLRSQKILSKTNTSITFDGYDLLNPLADNGVEVGQILCLSGETVVTPIPSEVNQLLIQSVIIRILESMNAPQQLSLALERFNRLKIQLRDLLTPRAENRLLKLRPNYAFLRRGL